MASASERVLNLLKTYSSTRESGQPFLRQRMVIAAAKLLPPEGDRVLVMQYVGAFEKGHLTRQEVDAGFKQSLDAAVSADRTPSHPDYRIAVMMRKEAVRRDMVPNHVANCWCTVILGGWQNAKGQCYYSATGSANLTYEHAQDFVIQFGD
jgi:hypothetical protein